MAQLPHYQGDQGPGSLWQLLGELLTLPITICSVMFMLIFSLSLSLSLSKTGMLKFGMHACYTTLTNNILHAQNNLPYSFTLCACHFTALIYSLPALPWYGTGATCHIYNLPYVVVTN